MSILGSPVRLVATSLRLLAAYPTPRMLPRMPTPARCRSRCDQSRSDDRYTVTNSGNAEQRDVVFGGNPRAGDRGVVDAPSRQGRAVHPGDLRPPRTHRCATELAVESMHDGRTFASDTITAWQETASAPRFMNPPRCRRAHVAAPRRADAPRAWTRRRDPDRPGGVVYPGSDLRIVDDVDLWSTNAPVGPGESFLMDPRAIDPRRSRGAPRGALVGDRRVSHRHRAAAAPRHQPGRRTPRPVDRCGRAHDRVPRIVPRRRAGCCSRTRARTRAGAGRSVRPTCSPTTAASSRRTRRPT